MSNCIKCHHDNPNVMVFVTDPSNKVTHLKATKLLMCMRHGANSGNVISEDEYRSLIDSPLITEIAWGLTRPGEAITDRNREIARNIIETVRGNSESLSYLNP